MFDTACCFIEYRPFASARQREFAAGEIIARRATITLLNQHASATRKLARALERQGGLATGSFALHLAGWSIEGQFLEMSPKLTLERDGDGLRR